MARSPRIFNRLAVRCFGLQAGCPRYPFLVQPVPQVSRPLAVVAILATVFLAAPAFATWAGNALPVANRHVPAKAKRKSKIPVPLVSLNCPANFITAIVSDGHGGIYVSSEDSGIYHGTITVGRANGGPQSTSATKPALKITTAWKHDGQTGARGLASNFITALCMDGRGRLWAGTNRHGVCVFNGKKWKHYGIVSGPLGCHVYAIAFDKPANQIWIATENGLSVYQCGGNGGAAVPSRNSNGDRISRVSAHKRIPRYAAHTWHYVATVGGSPREFNQLPPNPDCMAFDARGKIFVGTQCGGLAIGTPRATAHVNLKSFLSYQSQREIKYTWRIIHGPWHLSTRPFGSGLPSNLINAVRVTARHQVLVATDCGLAVSENDGLSFRYQRGHDYAAKVLGLWHPPAYFHRPSQRFLAKLLPGDHITALAQGAERNFWIGTWRNGFEVLNPRTRQSYRFAGNPANPKNGGYISQFCPITIPSVAGGVPSAAANGDGQPHRRLGENGRPGSPHHKALQQIMLVSYYGSGVWAFGKPIAGRRAGHNLVRAVPLGVGSSTRFPRPATPPTAKQLRRLGGHLATRPGFSRRAVYAGADWDTRGDEINHYGRQCGILCASGGIADNNLVWNPEVQVQPMQGPHAGRKDGLRRWVQWITTGNPNSLYAPWQGSRVESEWDDHGETYPLTFQGPGLAIALALPPTKAVYRLSLYFFNKDGHTGDNRQRDYLIQIYPLRRRLWRYLTPPPPGWPRFPRNSMALRWMTLTDRARPLTQARVVYFWGGVYERFILRSPGDYMVCIRRNYSLNTMLSGFFLDRLRGKPPARFVEFPSAFLAGVRYGPPKAEVPLSAGGMLAAAGGLWHAARLAFWHPGQARAVELLAYRSACSAHASRRLLRRWRWFLDIWMPTDHRRFARAMASGYAAFRARMARQAALFRAMQTAKMKGSKTFVWRGSWANPATQPAR